MRSPTLHSEIILSYEKLEKACIAQSHAETSLELTQQLRKFRGEMHRALENAKQATLDGIGGSTGSR